MPILVSNLHIDDVIKAAREIVAHKRVPFLCFAITQAMGLDPAKIDHLYDEEVAEEFVKLTGYNVLEDVNIWQSLSPNEIRDLIGDMTFKTHNMYVLTVNRMFILMKVKEKHPDHVFNGFPVAEEL